MPALTLVTRDYGQVYEKLVSLGPLVEELGVGAKGVAWRPQEEIEWLKQANGVVRGGVADGRPSLERAEDAAEAILAISGTTNGRLSHAGFEALEKRVGRPLADLVEGERDARIRWSDVQARPQKTLTSPEWSGNEAGDRQYSAFTINVERLKPWHTLTGRMHFFLDHQWMAEIGEQLPDLAAAAQHARALPRDRSIPAAMPWCCATLRRTRSGRSTPTIRTTR